MDFVFILIYLESITNYFSLHYLNRIIFELISFCAMIIYYEPYASIIFFLYYILYWIAKFCSQVITSVVDNNIYRQFNNIAQYRKDNLQ